MVWASSSLCNWANPIGKCKVRLLSWCTIIMSLSREASALWHSADAVDKLSRLEIPKQLTELEKRKRAAEIITNRTIAQRNKAIACDPRIASMANPMVRRDPNAIAEGGTSRRKKGVRDCSVAGAGGFRADIATDSSGKRVTLKAAMSLDQLDMVRRNGRARLESSHDDAGRTAPQPLRTSLRTPILSFLSPSSFQPSISW